MAPKIRGPALSRNFFAAVVRLDARHMIWIGVSGCNACGEIQSSVETGVSIGQSPWSWLSGRLVVGQSEEGDFQDGYSRYSQGSTWPLLRRHDGLTRDLYSSSFGLLDARNSRIVLISPTQRTWTRPAGAGLHLLIRLRNRRIR